MTYHLRDDYNIITQVVHVNLRRWDSVEVHRSFGVDAPQERKCQRTLKTHSESACHRSIGDSPFRNLSVPFRVAVVKNKAGRHTRHAPTPILSPVRMWNETLFNTVVICFLPTVRRTPNFPDVLPDPIYSALTQLPSILSSCSTF